MSTEELKQILENLVDPSCGLKLSETEGVKHVGLDSDKNMIVLIIAMAKLGGQEEKAFRRQIAKVVKIDCGFSGLKLQMEESKILNSIVRKKAHFIGVISGKGGVGKSSVAANIAYRMACRGKKVGLIDADIYGSSLPTILGMPHENPHFDENKRIIPLVKNNIEVISTEFFTDPGQPVIWRGGMLNAMLEHFFYDVRWADETEYVIVDFPPGTGDVSLDIKSMVPQCEMLLVTTPHPSASHVAVKAGHAAVTLGHKIIGVIENMSYFTNPVNKEKERIFGEGGGERVAEELETELVAQLPICQPIHHTDLYELDEENGKIYDEIVDYLDCHYLTETK
jgi:ATP-binding protein involved in chromosome partitioning